MKNKKLLKQIKKLVEENKRLKRELSKSKEKEEKFPQKGDKYYLIRHFGKVSFARWDNDDLDKGHLSIGNCFKTVEEAEFALEKLKVTNELKKFSRPFEYKGDNWVFYYDLSYKKMRFNSYCFFQLQGLFFESEERAREAIETVGEERIKKYYLEVK